jgi:Cft2 family RNA processing exonuclease
LSAHADQAALLKWLKHFETAPQRTFVVHGEAADGVRVRWIESPTNGAGTSRPQAPGTRIDL